MNELGHPLRVIRPGPRGDHHATGRDECQRHVAQLRHRLIGREEVFDDACAVGVITNVFRCSLTRDHEGNVISGVDVGEGKVCIPGI
jgi:hypothetical protein